MIQPAPPGAKTSPRTWCFMRPAMCRVRRPDGSEVLVGYGIGDKVQVHDPEMVYCIPPTQMKETVVLEDGSEIISWPDDLLVTRETKFVGDL